MQKMPIQFIHLRRKIPGFFRLHLQYKHMGRYQEWKVLYMYYVLIIATVTADDLKACWREVGILNSCITRQVLTRL